MKTSYSPQLRVIGIRGAYRRLLTELQTLLGSTFLRDTRFVIAHPVTASLFLDTYDWNYTVEDDEYDWNYTVEDARLKTPPGLQV